MTDRPTARLTLRSSSSEADVLGEWQLQNLCALSLNSCSGAGLMPKVRTKKCPAIQGVPLRREGRYAPSTPYNLPALPGVYLMQPTAIPGVKAIYFGSQRSRSTYPLSDAFVKGELGAGIKRLQAANPARFKKTEPDFVVYTCHTPFYLQAKTEDIRAGIYDDMNALQGQSGTYWSGAAWRAEDISMLWKYNEEVVLPMVLSGLSGGSVGLEREGRRIDIGQSIDNERKRIVHVELPVTPVR